MTDTDFDDVGPIDYLVVEFPADHPPDGSALPLLLDLVEANIIRVLDLVFVRKGADRSLVRIAVEDLAGRSAPSPLDPSNPIAHPNRHSPAYEPATSPMRTVAGYSPVPSARQQVPLPSHRNRPEY
ncbi:hypothetical protein [Rhodococcus jostii]|uniref:hypothetical protein n=1 Tax=Rhodococcus jostii TaxID=132919 RepID=UPI00365C4468